MEDGRVLGMKFVFHVGERDKASFLASEEMSRLECEDPHDGTSSLGAHCLECVVTVQV